MDFKAGLELMRFTSIGLGAIMRRVHSRSDAERFLTDALGRLPGAPAKMAQLLGMRGDNEVTAPEPMPLDLVKSLITQDAPRLAAELEFISPWAKAASLGQAHQARLKSGELVAIKIQYPEVAASVASQIEAVFGLTSFSPAKRYEFDADGVRDFLRTKLLDETHYEREASIQARFYDRYQGSSVVVPKIFKEFSGPNILTQSWEDSIPIKEFARKEAYQEKSNAANLLTSWMFDSAFGLQVMHADLHPSNFGFRRDDGQTKLVIYDFGATIDLDISRASFLYHWVIGTEEMNLLKVKAALQALGFCPNKLSPIESRLLDISRVLLKPLLCVEGPWLAADWEVQDELNRILGADKWWLRTAGPSWFLYLMRSVQGWHHALQLLAADVALGPVWSKWRETLRIASAVYPIHVDQDIVLDDSPKKMIAQSLRIKIVEASEELVDLTMPSRALENLQDLIPPHVLANCKEQGIDVERICGLALADNGRPQNLFELQSNGRFYRVWLE
jgi:hypothetical protein